jgi:hypothetical protein
MYRYVQHNQQCNIEPIFRSDEKVSVFLHNASTYIRYESLLERPKFCTAKTPTALVSFGKIV